jgi:hypothetical protein
MRRIVLSCALANGCIPVYNSLRAHTHTVTHKRAHVHTHHSTMPKLYTSTGLSYVVVTPSSASISGAHHCTVPAFDVSERMR